MPDVGSIVATVTRVRDVSPRIARVTFSVPGFAGTGCPDEWIGMFLDGRHDLRRRRVYSVRAHRPGSSEVDVDFVRHDHGPAMDWLATAAPGDEVRWWDQVGGSYALPQDAVTVLLAADLAGLPALGRIVEELPAGVRATVVVEAFDEEERQAWTSAAAVDVRWLHGSGEGRAPSRLGAAVLDHPPVDYLWMAGETREVRATRRVLRHERGLASERYSLVGYWLADREAWMRGYDARAAELEAIWSRGAEQGLDEEQITDAYDDALERAGL